MNTVLVVKSQTDSNLESFLLSLKIQHLDFNLWAKKITDVLRDRVKMKNYFDKLET